MRKIKISTLGFSTMGTACFFLRRKVLGPSEEGSATGSLLRFLTVFETSVIPSVPFS